MTLQKQLHLLHFNNFTEFLSSKFLNKILTNDSIHHADE